MKRPVNSIWGRSSPCNLFPPSEGEKERRKSRRRNQDSVSGFFTGGQEQRNRETEKPGKGTPLSLPGRANTLHFLFSFTGDGKTSFPSTTQEAGAHPDRRTGTRNIGEEKILARQAETFFSSGRDRDLLFSPLCFSRSSPQAEPGAGAAHVHVKRRRKTQQEWTSFR